VSEKKCYNGLGDAKKTRPVKTTATKNKNNILEKTQTVAFGLGFEFLTGDRRNEIQCTDQTDDIGDGGQAHGRT
jgi:hypothetical protein